MHIGKHIHNELKRQGRTVTWFARALNVVRTNAYDIFSRNTIDTELLQRICKILHYDFFKDLSDDLGSYDEEK
ncbi:MAG: XRE family transcriptional regulator, partial [Muribaculaceae bacterium]